MNLTESEILDAPRLSLGQAATLACLLEVSAAKPGNVHRAADFSDTSLNDFLASAVAIGPVFDQAVEQGVGQTVFQAVQATRRVTPRNTNLGIILLLAPLACARQVNRSELTAVLDGMTAIDSQLVYQAIRVAQPGGLQPASHDVTQHDLAGEAPADLREAMRVAASWDLIAKQFVTEFAIVREQIVPWIVPSTSNTNLPDRIIHAHLQTLAAFPDSLIRRKCGPQVAEEASARAQRVLEAGEVNSEAYLRALADLDFWLRSDGNRRNPGTTADLIAAAIFVALRGGLIRPPYH